jgi:hypothetical protein
VTHLDGSGPLLAALVIGLCGAVGVAVTGLVVRARRAVEVREAAAYWLREQDIDQR